MGALYQGTKFQMFEDALGHWVIPIRPFLSLTMKGKCQVAPCQEGFTGTIRNQ